MAFIPDEAGPQVADDAAPKDEPSLFKALGIDPAKLSPQELDAVRRRIAELNNQFDEQGSALVRGAEDRLKSDMLRVTGQLDAVNAQVAALAERRPPARRAALDTLLGVEQGRQQMAFEEPPATFIEFPQRSRLSPLIGQVRQSFADQMAAQDAPTVFVFPSSDEAAKTNTEPSQIPFSDLRDVRSGVSPAPIGVALPADTPAQKVEGRFIEDVTGAGRFIPDATEGRFIEEASRPLTDAETTAVLGDAARRETSMALNRQFLGGEDSFLRAVAEDPAGFLKALPEIGLGAITGPGKLAYAAAVDLWSKEADAMQTRQNAINQALGLEAPQTDYKEFGGNLKAMMTGGPLPVEKFLGEVSKTNPGLATIGKLGKSSAELAPLAAVGMLPSSLARLAAAGFTADMLLSAPKQFEAYAEEINKPKDEQDPDKLTTLQSDVLMTLAFAPLAGGHAMQFGPRYSAAQIIKDAFSKPLNAESQSSRSAPAPSGAKPPIIGEEAQADAAERALREAQRRGEAPIVPTTPPQFIGPGEAPPGQVKVTDESVQAEALTRLEAQRAELEARLNAPGQVIQSPDTRLPGNVAPEPPARAGAAGQNWTATTPATGDKVSGQWQVVDLPDIVTSDQPRFDQSLQPRDRSRAASQEQIAKIAAGLTPERLGESPTTDIGSPIVDEFNQALTGNGRLAALRQVYAAGAERAGAYKHFVQTEAARLGVDPAKVAEMQSPVLVRRVTDYGKLSKPEFARLSNESSVLGMSTAEKAGADASMLRQNPGLMDAFLPSEEGDVLAASNRGFLNAFVQGTGDAAELLNADGSYNAKTLAPRVKNAVLGAMLGHENRGLLNDLIDRAAELNVSKAATGVMQAAPRLLKHRGTAYDLGQPLSQALADLVRMRTKGEKLSEFLDQNQLFADPQRTAESDFLLSRLAEGASAKQIAEGLARYADLAGKQDLTTGDMFGEAPPARPELLRRAYENATQPPAASQENLSLGKPPATTPEAQREVVAPPESVPEADPIADNIAASKRAGNVHLDQLPHAVESLRGLEIESVRDGSKGRIIAVMNDGSVTVRWNDQASAKSNSAWPSMANQMFRNDFADFKVIDSGKWTGKQAKKAYAEAQGPAGAAQGGVQPEAPVKVGDIVRFNERVISKGEGKDVPVAGTVWRILDDGRLEVRPQKGGYRTLRPDELLPRNPPSGGSGLAASKAPGVPEFPVMEGSGDKRTKNLRVYRGEYTGNRGGGFFHEDLEFARQFTQSGQDKEISQLDISIKDIYREDPLPYGGDPDQIEAAVAVAKKSGFKAIFADEGTAGKPSVFVFDNAILRQAKRFETSGGSGLAASKSPGTTDFPVLLGGVEHIRPMETPEMLRLARDFAGSEVAVRKLRGYLRGYAKGKDIALSDKLFADPQQVAMTLAHEIGHVNDFMPEGTLKRGNLIGRLIGETHKFLSGTFQGLNNVELREELKALSAYWRPWDETTAGKSEKAYRNSAKELYADAISVLLNSPGLLEQRAPKFYKAFFEHLDAKPRFKEEFFALQDLLNRGPEAVIGDRLKQSREGFEKGEALLHEKIQFRQAARNSFKDFLTKVRIQSLDIAAAARAKLGSKDPRNASEFDRLYEEWKLDDNKNAADVQRIYHEMIQPLVKTGLDEHAFGQVLELQRIMGSLDAYKDMQTMRKTLGPERVELLRTLSDKLLELERKGVAEEQAIEQVIVPLERAGLEFDMIDKFRQLNEAQGTRAELANPQGRSPILAEAELNQLLAGVTPAQSAALLDAAGKFRKLLFDRATEARDVGIINATTFDKTIVPNKDKYAAFRPLDKIEPFVSPMVRRARGTLKDIENPFITTLLKLQSLNNLIETQRLKNSVRDQMGTLFPEDFKKAPTRWTGRRQEAGHPPPDRARVNILENGRLVAYDTDPYIAKVFDKLTPTDSFWLNKILEVPFRMGIYPLIIKYNPGFLFAFNPRRDMARTIRNLYAVEGVTRRELLPNYASPEVLRAVSDYLEGRPNPLAEAMIRNKAITTSWQGFSRIDQQDVMTDLLRRYKLAGTPEKHAITRGLMWLPNKINEAGSFLEALPKFASYKTLIERGVGPERAAFLVRNYAGTPNFKVKGEFANVQNSYVPFINIFTQGWRADLKLATSPKTAGGWWFQWGLQHGWQAVIVGLAVAGVFGDDVKKLYEGISEYDRTNYGTLPLGEQLGAGEFGSKTIYARTPRDETSRFFSAVTYKMTRAIADKAMGNPPHPQGLPSEVFAFGAGMTPSPTPILNVASAWKEYLVNRNPVDPFRNKPVMSERNYQAGGTAALGDMMTWTLNQSGALNLIQWNPRSETTTELVVSGVPVVNRILKVSDQGLREKQLNDKSLIAQEKAQMRVKYSDAVDSLVAQHNWLEGLGWQRRTPEQNQLYARLHAWKSGLYDHADEAAWLLREDGVRQREIINQVNASAEKFKDVIKPKASAVYTNSPVGDFLRSNQR